MVLFLLAEDTGFEPAEAINFNGFQDRRFKPLSQSSVFCLIIIYDFCLHCNILHALRRDFSVATKKSAYALS